MDQGYYLESIRADGKALAATAAGHLDAAVPTCPDWDGAALVGHMGRVWSWVTAIVALGGAAPGRDAAMPPPQDRTELMPWFEQRHRGLLEALGTHHPADPAWNFLSGSEQTVGWWLRRQALEVAVHRIDAESACGTSHQIDPPLAVEGIDELLTVFLPRLMDPKPDALSGTLHVHVTDAAGEWSLDLTGSTVTVTKEHSKSDAAVRGPASDLYLWLSNRVGVDAAGLEVFGDGAIVAAWRQVKF